MNGLANLIREARENQRRPDGKPWTQDDLADAMDVSRGYIGQIETGLIKRPRMKYRKLFQDKLHITDNQWLTATGEMQPASGVDLNSEIHRIAQIPDIEDRVAELDELEKSHPEIVRLMEAVAFRRMRESFR